MRYQPLLNQLMSLGYEFQEKHGQYQVTNKEPPLMHITHRYPGKKKGRVETSTGYVTHLDLPNRPPEDTRLYWGTNYLSEENGSRWYIGSNWSQLRHIAKCSLATKDPQTKKR